MPMTAGAVAVQRYFETTARLTPQDRALSVGSMVDVAKRHGLTAAGIVSSAESRRRHLQLARRNRLVSSKHWLSFRSR